MLSFQWPDEHCNALRELLARGLAYSEIARNINARFGTSYTRNAAIGRARRMGLVGSGRPDVPKPPPRAPAPRLHRMRQKRERLDAIFRVPVFERDASLKLRCADVTPRHLGLLDLEAGDCRYPYGGDTEGEAITFCGCPVREGSSYCVPHVDLTRGPGTRAERAAVSAVLRLAGVA